MRDRNQSMEEFAGHLKRSWDPRMRRALMEHIEHHSGEGLNPLVLEAVKVHKLI